MLVFGSPRATCILNLRGYLFANKLILKSILCLVVFSTQLNSSSAQQDQLAVVLFLGSPLSVYSGIHQLLLVADCQLSSNTISILLTPYLSRQHITAYLY